MPQSAVKRKAGWQPVRGETLSRRIVRQIRAALFAGELTPGEALGGELRLAQKFGVSRMAMRDALRSLAAAGIVDIRVGARGGVFIAHGDPERFADALAIQLKLIGVGVEEMFDAQIAIEVTATEFAARRLTPADRESLHALLAELDAIAASPMHAEAPLRFTELSMRFHEALVEASHNRALIAQFKALRFVLEPVYARRTTGEVARRVVASHRAVLERVEAGDAEGARQLMHWRLQVVRARQLTAAVAPEEKPPPT